MADLSQFKEAAAAVQHSPHAVSAWEEVESLAAELEKPDDVVLLYSEALSTSIEPAESTVSVRHLKPTQQPE